MPLTVTSPANRGNAYSHTRILQTDNQRYHIPIHAGMLWKISPSLMSELGSNIGIGGKKKDATRSVEDSVAHVFDLLIVLMVSEILTLPCHLLTGDAMTAYIRPYHYIYIMPITSRLPCAFCRLCLS